MNKNLNLEIIHKFEKIYTHISSFVSRFALEASNSDIEKNDKSIKKSIRKISTHFSNWLFYKFFVIFKFNYNSLYSEKSGNITSLSFTLSIAKSLIFLSPTFNKYPFDLLIITCIELLFSSVNFIS